MASRREEKHVASGSNSGLARAVYGGVFYAGFAVFVAIKMLGDDGFGGGEYTQAALMMVVLSWLLGAAPITLYSGVDAWRSRRAGTLAAKDRKGMSGETKAWKAFEAGEPWAVAVGIFYGLVAMAAGALCLVKDRSAGTIALGAGLVLLGFFVVRYAVGKRRKASKPASETPSSVEGPHGLSPEGPQLDRDHPLYGDASPLRDLVRDADHR
jgi:hypothetical protein